MDKCGICGELAIDTHHIKYQSDADSEGFLESHHKNIKHNLAPLCKSCHIKEHNGDITIEGYVQTSHGIILSHKYI
jgi:5-methylcytosine-specific restriction endonuclease McrA